jgi:hypothetical protein
MNHQHSLQHTARWVLLLAGLSTTCIATCAMPHAGASMIAHASLPSADMAEAVRTTVLAMQHAVIAGDADAYLAHVDRREPEWWREQRNWAADIKAKTPETMRIEVGEDWTFGEFDGASSAEVSLRWVWTPKPDVRVEPVAPADTAKTKTETKTDTKAETKPAPSKERELTFRARFVQREGDVLYAGEAWQTVERAGVIVCFDPGLDDAAAHAADAFISIREGVERELGLEATAQPSRTQRIKLYGSMRHLQHSIYPSYVFPLSGWNEPEEAIKAVAKPDATQKSFIALLAHEYGHVASFELGSKANFMPWWALEGLAELMVDAHDPMLAQRSRKQVIALHQASELVPLADLADFEKVPLRLHGRVYRQGHDMLRYVSTTFGVAQRNMWLAEMSIGQSIDQASNKALGKPWQDIEAAWREQIAQEAAKNDEAAEQPTKEPGSK